jgi:hypothetical protein
LDPFEPFGGGAAPLDGAGDDVPLGFEISSGTGEGVHGPFDGGVG